MKNFSDLVKNIDKYSSELNGIDPKLFKNVSKVTDFESKKLDITLNLLAFESIENIRNLYFSFLSILLFTDLGKVKTLRIITNHYYKELIEKLFKHLFYFENDINLNILSSPINQKYYSNDLKTLYYKKFSHKNCIFKELEEVGKNYTNLNVFVDGDILFYEKEVSFFKNIYEYYKNNNDIIFSKKKRNSLSERVEKEAELIYSLEEFKDWFSYRLDSDKSKIEKKLNDFKNYSDSFLIFPINMINNSFNEFFEHFEVYSFECEDLALSLYSSFNNKNVKSVKKLKNLRTTNNKEVVIISENKNFYYKKIESKIENKLKK